MNDSPANAVQHGGTHYQASFQHWDFVAALGLGYFEAQVTRYICRHRKKAGVLDVEKAGHYVQKLIELAEEGMPAARRNNFSGDALAFQFALSRRLRIPTANHEDLDFLLMGEFLKAQSLTALERETMFLMCHWNDIRHLRRALDLVHQIKEEYRAADATRAYNAQSLDSPAAPTLTPEQVRAADDVAQHATSAKERP